MRSSPTSKTDGPGFWAARRWAVLVPPLLVAGFALSLGRLAFAQDDSTALTDVAAYSGGAVGGLALVALAADKIAQAVKGSGGKASRRDDLDDLRREVSEVRAAHSTTREEFAELRATVAAISLQVQRIEGQLVQVIELLSTR